MDSRRLFTHVPLTTAHKHGSYNMRSGLNFREASCFLQISRDSPWTTILRTEDNLGHDAFFFWLSILECVSKLLYMLDAR
ncbi:hypothetical protein TNCV_3935961 [Trichonephila clavipes]|nr:hypothetical protein TNCV_3935961 [Trichonephila clavipes]